MNPRRTSHCILVGLALALLGAFWWWTARRLSPLTSGSREPVANLSAGKEGGDRATHIANITGKRAPRDPAAARRPGRESPERRAQLARVIALERDLARAQEAALAGLEEREYPSALAALADAQSEAIAAATVARNELLSPPDAQADPAPLAGAEARQARFEAVRHSIIEGGLSTEEAEARSGPAHPDP